MQRGHWAILACFLAISGPLMTLTAAANGFGGDSPPARIPIPARDYSAVVEDQGGVRVEVTQVSYNGEIFLYGALGQGQVTVPFDRIQTVRFEPSGHTGKLIALAELKDGERVRVEVNDDVPCYGKTSFGTYRITAQNIRKIEFP